MPLPQVLESKENKTGGILIVTMPGYAPQKSSSRRSFFFDRQLDHGAVLNTFSQWFDLWGIPVERSRGCDTDFERRFFTHEWPKTPITDAHGPQTIPKIALSVFELIEVIAKRQPRIIIFLSCYLWKAVNTVQEAFLTTLGQPRDNGRRITNKRLAAYIQRWDKCTMLALPQPSKNTTDDYVISLSQGVREALRINAFEPSHSEDPLIQAAAKALVIDKEASIRLIQTELHVVRDRAEKLFDALEGISYKIDTDGKLRTN